MKFLTLLTLFMFPLTTIAGFYGYNPVDTYDPSSGLYYKSVKIDVEGQGYNLKGQYPQIVNVNVFNPSTGQGRFIFPVDASRDITIFLFEEKLHDGSVNFYNASREIIKNNENIAKREIKDKILIGIKDRASGSVVLYTSDKAGKKIDELGFVPKEASFHIDVRNSKLRVVKDSVEGVEIKSYEW